MRPSASDQFCKLVKAMISDCLGDLSLYSNDHILSKLLTGLSDNSDKFAKSKLNRALWYYNIVNVGNEIKLTEKEEKTFLEKLKYFIMNLIIELDAEISGEIKISMEQRMQLSMLCDNAVLAPEKVTSDDEKNQLRLILLSFLINAAIAKFKKETTYEGSGKGGLFKFVSESTKKYLYYLQTTERQDPTGFQDKEKNLVKILSSAAITLGKKNLLVQALQHFKVINEEVKVSVDLFSEHSRTHAVVPQQQGCTIS